MGAVSRRAYQPNRMYSHLLASSCYQDEWIGCCRSRNGLILESLPRSGRPTHQHGQSAMFWDSPDLMGWLTMLR